MTRRLYCCQCGGIRSDGSRYRCRTCRQENAAIIAGGSEHGAVLAALLMGQREGLLVAAPPGLWALAGAPAQEDTP